MERKTAVAAASAISMSLVAATIAIGANLGALGFASSSPATPVRPNAAIVSTEFGDNKLDPHRITRERRARARSRYGNGDAQRPRRRTRI